MVGFFRRRRPFLEWDPGLPSQPIQIDQVRIGRSHMESGLSLRTTTTGAFRTPTGGLTRQSGRVIRITFRIVPSKDGGTSSEARTARDRFPPGPHPILPAAIPPRRYPELQNNDVSFPLPSGDVPPPGILTIPVVLFPF